jgi:methyl-accepting chemotaxis protein-1 (serine sensor receptor)
MTLLGLLILLTGLGGLYGMSYVNARLLDVNEDTMPSSVAIASSQLALSRARLALDRVTMHPDFPGVEKTLARAESFVAESDQAWRAYLALPRDEEEQRLADDMETQRKKFMAEGLQPLLAMLKAKDAAGADAITMKRMQPLFARMSDSATALTDFQSRTNQEHYIDSQASYCKLRWVTIATIGLSVAMIVLASLSLVRSIVRPITTAIAHFDRIASGDLSGKIEVTGRDEMAALLGALVKMQTQLIVTVSGLRGGSAAISTATTEIAAGNVDLSRRTEQQAASLEKTAASLEELTVTVQQNAENARLSNQLAHAASETARKGGVIVTQVVGTMNGIRASSTRIGDIIGVIDGIAFQTNILALNAAVEAARAGEQGRGFAVVASEVRNLAQRSAQAAKDIKLLITSSVEQVDGGGRLVGEAGQTMGEIVASIARVAEIMNDISVAGREQEIGISQINRAVAELDDVTQQNAALVEQATAASESLRQQAAELAAMVDAFKLTPQNATTSMAIGKSLRRDQRGPIALENPFC